MNQKSSSGVFDGQSTAKVATGDGFPVSESPSGPRQMRPLRFATGLMLTTCGMTTVLMVGMKFLEVQQVGGDFALVLVALGVLTGVILLGGGFGLMATASSGFDEREFHTLMKAGNISASHMAPEDPAGSEPKAA